MVSLFFTFFRQSASRSRVSCHASAQPWLVRRAGALAVLALVLWAACASMQWTHDRVLDTWAARQASTAAADAALLSAARDADPSSPLADQLLKSGTEPQSAFIELGIEPSGSIDPLETLHLHAHRERLSLQAGSDRLHARLTQPAVGFFSLPLRPPRFA
jgi:hypothetical protein